MTPACRSAIAALLATLSAATLGAAPASAETTPTTDAFAAATAQAFAFLDEADALAGERAGSPRLRAFARRDAAREAAAAEELAAWGAGQRAADRAAALTPSLDRLGPLFYPLETVVLPFDVHGHRSTDADRAALARLAATQGQPFDALYAATAAGALDRLAGAYTDYIENGDDPALRRLAVRELPVVRRLREELPAH